MTESREAVTSRRSIMTVGVLRQVLAEYHESDIVMIDGGETNTGVTVERIKLQGTGTRVLIGDPDDYIV